jgi:hypothetical protein
MGKRSRGAPKDRAGGSGGHKDGLRGRIAAAADDVERRTQRDRPPAPWDPFPLTELAIFLGIVLMVIGAVIGVESFAGRMPLVTGFLFVVVGTLDNVWREHFSGFRSHTWLLASIAGVATLAISSAAGLTIPIRASAAVLVTVVVWFPLRRIFLSRSGGRKF